MLVDLRTLRGSLSGLRTAAGPVPLPVFPKSDAREERPRRWRSVGLWERLTWAVGALVCLVVGLRFHNAPATLPNWTLTRITADAGLSGFPALSPDGNLMAYSSDRGLNGEQDLYVRQVAGGQPIRLTFDGAGNTTPDFSPDGTRIVFRSNRNGGGIYEVPALGGEARLLARGGLNPKYSPDGSLVAYWVGTEAVSAAVPGSGAVWVVPVTGGASAPDSRALLGCTSADLASRREALAIRRIHVVPGIRKLRHRLVGGRDGWRLRGKDGRLRGAGPRRPPAGSLDRKTSVAPPLHALRQDVGRRSRIPSSSRSRQATRRTCGKSAYPHEPGK